MGKQNDEYNFERETVPRFANPGTFEYEYGTKWKALYELKKQKEEALKTEMKLEEAKLIAQMEFSRFEHETDMLREELRKKEAVRDQHKSMWSVKEKYMEDIMKQEQERQRALEDEIKEESQNNSLIAQAQNLSSILDLQNCLSGLGQTAGLSDLETLNTLLNLQQAMQTPANMGNNMFGNSNFDLRDVISNSKKTKTFDADIDVEDLHMQGEMENKRKRRKQ